MPRKTPAQSAQAHEAHIAISDRLVPRRPTAAVHENDERMLHTGLWRGGIMKIEPQRACAVFSQVTSSFAVMTFLLGVQRTEGRQQHRGEHVDEWR